MSILSLPIEPQNAKNGDMYYNTVEQKYYSFKDGEWVEQVDTENATSIVQEVIVEDNYIKNTATGTNALTINSVNKSNLNETVNIGYNSRVGSQFTVAIGSGSDAQGTGAVALGYVAKAQRNGFAALGQAHANSAHIIGRGINTETNTFKVALVGSDYNMATDEASGLYTLLNSDGSVPLDRTFNTLLYHDLFAFQRNGMAIVDNMTTVDGETWTESDRDFHKLFICKDTDAPISILTADEVGHTFTLDTMEFSYSDLEYIEFTTNWVPTSCDFDLKVEFSTDKGSWTTLVEKTGLQSQKTYFYKFNQSISGQCRYIKFTFIKTTNLDTGIININALKGYTKRLSGQGGGRNTILPFSWDDDNIIYPSKNDVTTSLGKSNSRWYSIYGGNLYGWNLHASSNIRIGGDNGLPERSLSGVYNYQVYNKNTNNYQYHRIAKIDWTDNLKAFSDGCAYIEIMSYYKDGKYGKIKASIRSNEKTADPFAHAEIIWMDRRGFKVDDVQGALYTVTDGDNSRTYLDVFLKLDHPWETYSLKFTRGDRGDLFGDLDYVNNNELFQVLSSSEEMNNSTVTECYTAIQGNEAGTAAYDLHNGTQYTTIINGVDGKAYIENTATGNLSLTILGASSTGVESTNVGIQSVAGWYATSLGRNARASGGGSTALGRSALADKNNSVAIGTNARSTAIGAIALGALAINNEAKTFKVALTDKDANTPAVDESTGLFTLLESNGKIPMARLPFQKVCANNTALTSDGTNCKWVITHNLGTKDVMVSVYNLTTDVEPVYNVEHTSTNTISIIFNSATDIPADSYRAVIIG